MNVLIIATSGRFTSDAVAWIEQHNHAGERPITEMWPDSQFETLLAERPHLVAESDLGDLRHECSHRLPSFRQVDATFKRARRVKEATGTTQQLPFWSLKGAPLGGSEHEHGPVMILGVADCHLAVEERDLDAVVVATVATLLPCDARRQGACVVAAGAPVDVSWGSAAPIMEDCPC